MHKLYLLLILLNCFFPCYAQPGGHTCDSAVTLPLPLNVYPYYQDSAAWSTTGLQTQASPAWFKFVVPAGIPATDFMIAGWAMGSCSTTNKLLRADIVKNNCATPPIQTAYLNSCIQSGGPPNMYWWEDRGRAWLTNIAAGDTFFVKIYGATSLGYGVGLRWYNDIPHLDSCAQTDTIRGPVTYGSNYYADSSSFEQGLMDSAGTSVCQWFYSPNIPHQFIGNPVYYTLIPTADSFSLHVTPLECINGGNFFRLFCFSDCAHIGDYSKDTSGHYLYFHGCSDTSGITVTGVQPGSHLIIRIDPYRWLPGDFEIWGPEVCTFKITGAGYIMPINQVTFHAAYNSLSNKTDLSWITEVDIHGNKFIIQRSDDAVHFYTIAEVKGDGRSKYYFTDPASITSKAYYRLKILDPDNKFLYSAIATVFNEERNQVSVYPNPATDHIVVKAKDIRSVAVLSNDGRIVLKSRTTPSDYKTLNIGTLPTGIYLLQITNSEGQSYRAKVLKE